MKNMVKKKNDLDLIWVVVKAMRRGYGHWVVYNDDNFSEKWKFYNDYSWYGDVGKCIESFLKIIVRVWAINCGADKVKLIRHVNVRWSDNSCGVTVMRRPLGLFLSFFQNCFIIIKNKK